MFFPFVKHGKEDEKEQNCKELQSYIKKLPTVCLTVQYDLG